MTLSNILKIMVSAGVLSFALPVQAQTNGLTLPQPEARIQGYEGLVGESAGLLIILEQIQDLNEKCKNGTIEYSVYERAMIFERNNFLAGSRHLRNHPELTERFVKDFPIYGDCHSKAEVKIPAPMLATPEPTDLGLISIADDIEQGRKDAEVANKATNCNILNRELGELEERKGKIENLLSQYESALGSTGITSSDALSVVNANVISTKGQLERINLEIIDKKRKLRECREKNRANEEAATFSATGGYAVVNPPKAGYATRFLTASEEFIAKTDDSYSGYTLGGSLAPGGSFSRANNLEFGLEYTNVKGTSEGSVANGTDGVGIVYNDRAPNGSTGLGLGPRGMDVKTKSISERLRLQFDMSTETDGGVSFGSRVRFGGGVEFTDTKHEASVTTPSFNDISSTSVQDLNEAYFFGNLSTEIPATPNTGSISLILIPMLEAGYRHVKLASEQHNICGLCGAPEQDFRININDDDGGLYYGGSLEARLSARVSELARIGLSAKLGYRSHAAEIINPETGDDLFIRNNPTHLETDSEYRQSLSAWFSADF